MAEVIANLFPSTLLIKKGTLRKEANRIILNATVTKEIAAGLLGVAAIIFQSETLAFGASGFFAYGMIDLLVGIGKTNFLPRENLPKSKSRY